ncbi:hypothetical protein CONPUDRAFT_69595 [Coniophora puteana RWD-64-598 SS2]|uniref:Uncharacterized protein n=1 Tax=Coniophora puteana (strain RWD-64-598) TaxID=741705 RepID=A0A5M3N7U6_CONPW|nr:uncharacterized protein CONPUDRAFT_69595 [Coniophora puteana RWD-64-598 SS2]EIW87368.1 hypothetical protein CONPUDRAFT_69595 [Coniophora puteana RWD-64-598 SS2]
MSGSIPVDIVQFPQWARATSMTWPTNLDPASNGQRFLDAVEARLQAQLSVMEQWRADLFAGNMETDVIASWDVIVDFLHRFGDLAIPPFLRSVIGAKTVPGAINLYNSPGSPVPGECLEWSSSHSRARQDIGEKRWWTEAVERSPSPMPASPSDTAGTSTSAAGLSFQSIPSKPPPHRRPPRTRPLPGCKLMDCIFIDNTKHFEGRKARRSDEKESEASYDRSEDGDREVVAGVGGEDDDQEGDDEEEEDEDDDEGSSEASVCAAPPANVRRFYEEDRCQRCKDKHRRVCDLPNGKKACKACRQDQKKCTCVERVTAERAAISAAKKAKRAAKKPTRVGAKGACAASARDNSPPRKRRRVKDAPQVPQQPAPKKGRPRRGPTRRVSRETLHEQWEADLAEDKERRARRSGNAYLDVDEAGEDMSLSRFASPDVEPSTSANSKGSSVASLASMTSWALAVRPDTERDVLSHLHKMNADNERVARRIDELARVSESMAF